jgi:hypothetical protein
MDQRNLSMRTGLATYRPGAERPGANCSSLCAAAICSGFRQTAPFLLLRKENRES